MKSLKRIGMCAAVATVVSGCALPPALEVASLVLGGGSWVFTGKGIGDHALSVAIDEDCAMVRPVIGKPICMPNTVAAEEDKRVTKIAVGGVRLKGVEQVHQFASLISELEGEKTEQIVRRGIEQRFSHRRLTDDELENLVQQEMAEILAKKEKAAHQAELQILAEQLNEIETAANDDQLGDQLGEQVLLNDPRLVQEALLNSPFGANSEILY